MAGNFYWPIVPTSDPDCLNPFRPGPFALAFRKGFLCARDGGSRTDNPYYGTNQFHAWATGFYTWQYDREQRIFDSTEPGLAPAPSTEASTAVDPA